MFLYSVTPEHALLRFSEMYSIHPLDDGFTSSMKALLRKACQVRQRVTALKITADVTEIRLAGSTGRTAA